MANSVNVGSPSVDLFVHGDSHWNWRHFHLQLVVLDLLLVICGCLVLGDSFVHNIRDLLDGDIGVCIPYIKMAHSQTNWALYPICMRDLFWGENVLAWNTSLISI